MIFLIAYDRSKGEVIEEKIYDNAEIEHANADRLRQEIRHSPDSGIEIVILQSDSREELERTHARYFKTVRQLQQSA